MCLFGDFYGVGCCFGFYFVYVFGVLGCVGVYVDWWNVCGYNFDFGVFVGDVFDLVQDLVW